MKPHLLRLFPAFALALLTAACFQPMYAQRSTAPGVTNDARAMLSRVDIATIDGRVGQVIRNNLVFGITGGGMESPNKDYQLVVALRESAESAVVDPFTDRPEVETLALDAGFSLIRSSTGEKVFTGNAFGRASYNRTRQRYATVRAQRDAEDRAAKVLADQILVRLAAHFATAR